MILVPPECLLACVAVTSPFFQSLWDARLLCGSATTVRARDESIDRLGPIDDHLGPIRPLWFVTGFYCYS